MKSQKRVSLPWRLTFTSLAIVSVLVTPRSLPAEESSEHDLERAAILQQVLLRVSGTYVDPGRIRPRLMLVQGLDWVQQSVAAVQVRYELPPADFAPPSCDAVSDCAGTPWPLQGAGDFECFEGECRPIPAELTVQVDAAQRTFSTADVRGPWDLSRRMREVFAFLEHGLHDDVERPEVEYAAINGMLSTLDPHSNLLVPEVFAEMQLGTRGEFGGLGIVISVHPGSPCDGALTIMEVMDGSPAETAGLRRMDRITRIGDQPTACMDLSEAVNRLRGTPGTSVRVWMRRAGEGRQRPVDIVRAQIQIDSVESRMLQDGVGYVQLKSFQVNTTTELRSHLSRMRSEGMEALVLDLRDNPGGLLDQAVRVADSFLSSGTIVVTAGARPEDRETQRAEPAGTEPSYPIVVLVNGGSASASEIVAGALRNQGRAIIIGERTFGKGSVQTLYEFDDGSALKLTVAQYLTPGDESIQTVGIIPDVEFQTMTVERNQIDLDPRSGTMRESDLGQHLEHAGPAAREAQLELRLLRREPAPETAGRCPVVVRCDREQEEPWSEEAVAFARELLARGTGAARSELMRAAAQLVAERQAEEVEAVAAALRPMRVDWAPGESSGAPEVETSITVGGADNRADAGSQAVLRVRARNRGGSTIYRLRGTTKSDNPFFDDREVVLGRLGPGQSRSWDVPVCVPAGATSRTDPVTVELVDGGGNELPSASTSATVVGLEHPAFSYGVQLIDDAGNGDGALQRGERARIRLVLRNDGSGDAQEADVRWRNKAGDQVVVRSCRHRIGRLAVSEQRVVETELEVDQGYAESTVPLELSITDTRMHEQVVERIEIPVAQPAPAPTPVSTFVAARAEGVPLREAPSAQARIVARAGSGAAFAAGARQAGFYRVSLDPDRTAWISEADTTSASRAAPAVTEVLANRPPRIELVDEPPLAVRGESLHLEGVVSDPDRVLDMYIFVGNRKLYYLSNRSGSDSHRLRFATDVPLEGGSNQVLIVARETADLVARRHVVVRRDNPDGSPMPTRGARRGE